MTVAGSRLQGARQFSLNSKTLRGVTSRVSSPSFIVVATHEGGRLPFWHADLYRVVDEDEIEQLGLDEALEGNGVVLIEWAERCPRILPPDHLNIRLDEHARGRQIWFEATGPRHRRAAGSYIGAKRSDPPIGAIRR